ncbi:hypothetical protein [Phenylobacterium montanum]|uniref:Uncharacterized protein n=1 Tax=Phenylobacterium montanum TaxID=2823693 RepID=A0A975ITL5_9CAUL|nr:hypothetical protein [Caulobacter sp. S6]QUD86594.1 hypothetical protein KCG34_16075 [Caulobacter sp. S6]
MEDLAELSALGMELARSLAKRGIEAARAGKAEAVEAERSFSRLTRAVRLTMALEARLSESLLPQDKPGAAQGAPGKGPQGQGPEDGFWMPYSQLNGATQRLKEKLAKFIKNAPAPEDGDGEDDFVETSEGREREARERLVETEEELPDWLMSGGRAAEFPDGVDPFGRPAGGHVRPAGDGFKARGPAKATPHTAHPGEGRGPDRMAPPSGPDPQRKSGGP